MGLGLRGDVSDVLEVCGRTACGMTVGLSPGEDIGWGLLFLQLDPRCSARARSIALISVLTLVIPLRKA